MRKENFLKKIGLVFLFAFFAIGSQAVFAQPNLQVLPWQGPTAAMVNTPYQYKVSVKNTGNQPAQNVKVVVDLPLTDTSPARHILGKATALGTGCRIVANKIECSLDTINRNKTKFFTFNFELPVSTKTLTFKATASTTSANEINPNNNFSLLTPSLGYATNQLISANVLVSLCTGQGLTSYFECELYPSSIQSFTMTLDAGGAISNIPDQSYSGTWDQLLSPQQLHFIISNGADGAEFNGFASSANCFEGMTNFIPSSPYSSPYKVCVQ